MVTYTQIPVPSQLAPYVKYYWVLKTTGTLDAVLHYRVLADGCPGMIINNGEGFSQHLDRGTPEPFFFVYGQTTRHIDMYATGAPIVIGAYFYPHVLPLLFNLSSKDFTNQSVPIESITGKTGEDLTHQLLDDTTITGKINLLNDFILSRLLNARTSDAPMLHCATMITHHNGNVIIKSLQKLSGLSERQFERRFADTIGITPKLYARIMRFQQAVKQLKLRRYSSLTAVAYDNSYADQAHFIRDFKAFSGFSPKEYVKTNEPVENFACLSH